MDRLVVKNRHFEPINQPSQHAETCIEQETVSALWFRGDGVKRGFEPSSVGARRTGDPGFEGRSGPGSFGLTEIKGPRRQRRGRIPSNPFLAGKGLGSEVNGLFLFGSEGEVSWMAQHGADGGQVAALGAGAMRRPHGFE